MNHEIIKKNTLLTKSKLQQVHTTSTKTQQIQYPHLRKNLKFPFFLDKPNNKNIQPPDLEIDFSIDSGAESNIINFTSCNELSNLHQ